MAQNNDEINVVFDAEFWGRKEFCDNLSWPPVCFSCLLLS